MSVSMFPSRQTCSRLRMEHLAVVSLLSRLRAALLVADAPSDLVGPSARRLFREVSIALGGEVRDHFSFEERALFPRLADAGEGGLVAHFLDEHAAIYALLDALGPCFELAATGRLDDRSFRVLHAKGIGLCEQLTTHSEQEDAAMLPLLDDLLDESGDEEVLGEYELGARPSTPPR